MRFDEDTIRALKAQHGDKLYILSGGGHEVAVTSPTPEAYERYLSLGASPEQRHSAPSTLFFDCVVAPDKDALRKIFEDKPALPTLFGGQCAKIGGGDEKVEVKKA